MAIAPTPNNNIYKGLVFDDIDSRDYGIYITGEAVFNSPERDVEMIEIPGRNGTYALDKGRFHNIEVTYPAGLFGGSEAEFAAGIRAFRNALASRIGYKRLEDDYNPDEYRMAVYSSGLDVTPAQLKAGEFDIKFNCKPQRFLKSGESVISVGTSSTITNPTLYDSHPLLSFTASGSGTININSNTIAVTNQPIGDIILANVTKLASGESVTWSDTGRYLTGDAIRIDSIPAITTTVILDTYSYANYTQYSGDDMDYLSTTATARGTMTQHSIPNPPQFVAGTARSVSYSGTVTNKVKNKSSGTIVDCTINLTVTIAYDGAHSITATTNVTTSLGTASTTVTIDTVTVNSTKSSLTGTAYIDLDIGEAYSIDGGAVVSINDSVSLGASLPVLKPSTNTISKTGSVANLTIIPRWWEL